MITVNDLAVIDGDLFMPLCGIWTMRAVLDCDDAQAPTGAVTVKISDEEGGAAEWAGRVLRGAAPGSEAHMHIVGGPSGGLITEEPLAVSIQAQHYDGDPTPVTLWEIAQDIATLAGERLAAGQEAALRELSFVSWMRGSGLAQSALKRLLPAAYNYRLTMGNEVWIGQETWPVSAAKIEPFGFVDDGFFMRFTIAKGALLPGQTISAPGTALDGRRARDVRYIVSGDDFYASARRAA